MKLPTSALSLAPRSRPGFTFVELMIVMAIIGVVVSLVASATMQVIIRQKTANTELTIQKVNEALKEHWRVVVEQAKARQIPDNILYGSLQDPNFNKRIYGFFWMEGGALANAR